MDLFSKIKESADYIKKNLKCKKIPVGIILGTGLGSLSNEIKNKKELDYNDIPHFCKSTVTSHSGKIVSGTISGKSVIAMEGRLHFYEGYSLEEITFPVRVMKALGVKNMFISNACGGINPQYSLGDIMFIEDHINMMGINPLIGPNDERLGPRFPDMCEPYDLKLLKMGVETAIEHKIKVQKGVYVGVTGPNLETRAEYRFLKTIGSDVVGMSTVPEVIVAVHAGIKVVGLSIVTDLCLPDCLKPADISEIIRVAGEAEPGLTLIVKNMIKKLK